MCLLYMFAQYVGFKRKINTVNKELNSLELN